MEMDFQEIIDSIIETIKEFASLSVTINLPNEPEFELNIWIPVITIALLGIIMVSFRSKS